VSEACAEIAELMSKVEEGARRAQEEEEEGVRRQSKHKDHYMVELEQGKYADLLMMGGRSSVSSGYNSLSQGGGSESGDSLLGRPSLYLRISKSIFVHSISSTRVLTTYTAHGNIINRKHTVVHASWFSVNTFQRKYEFT
jgi:hypothetical protein